MSRLAIEVKPGVFVATIGARVRDKLWEKICDDWNLSAIMLYSTNNEQGYILKSTGDPNREVVNLDGIYLLAKTDKHRAEPSEEADLDTEDIN